MLDIDYFSEQRLNKKCLCEFRNELPARLRDLVELKDRDSMYVLQGYRGPGRLCDESSGDSESIGATNGIQTVKFRHGASKAALIVPVAGLLVWSAVRLLQDNSWQTLYFEEHSGELLSNSWSKANEILEERREA